MLILSSRFARSSEQSRKAQSPPFEPLERCSRFVTYSHDDRHGGAIIVDNASSPSLSAIKRPPGYSQAQTRPTISHMCTPQTHYVVSTYSATWMPRGCPYLLCFHKSRFRSHVTRVSRNSIAQKGKSKRERERGVKQKGLVYSQSTEPIQHRRKVQRG